MVVTLGSTTGTEAQGPPASAPAKCDIQTMVDDLKKDTRTSGPGLYVRAIQNDLKRFKKNVTDLGAREDVIPKTQSPLGPSLKKKFESFANVDADDSEFEELLRDVVAAQSDAKSRTDFCTRCRLLRIWKVFNMADYPGVTPDILDMMRSRRNAFELMKNDADALAAERARPDPRQTIIDELNLSIKAYLNAIPFQGKLMEWDKRYGIDKDHSQIPADPKDPLNPRHLPGWQYGKAMENLGVEQCGEEK